MQKLNCLQFLWTDIWLNYQPPLHDRQERSQTDADKHTNIPGGDEDPAHPVVLDDAPHGCDPLPLPGVGGVVVLIFQFIKLYWHILIAGNLTNFVVFDNSEYKLELSCTNLLYYLTWVSCLAMLWTLATALPSPKLATIRSPCLIRTQVAEMLEFSSRTRLSFFSQTRTHFLQEILISWQEFWDEIRP